ncbi:MAG: glycosyltransferase, partial [Rikenella sp.]|nr:glycosyltransferase [Rikenella sp.]
MVKVSVITVVWNAAAELERTLENLARLERTAAELEVLVIDGGSTDGTRAVIERFGASISYAVSEPVYYTHLRAHET